MRDLSVELSLNKYRVARTLRRLRAEALVVAEAAEAAGGPLAHVYPGSKRLVGRGQVFSPARGFCVPIPPEFRTWGSVPATHSSMR